MLRSPATATASAWRVVEYHAVNARRYLASVIVLSVLTPLVYLLALGVGLGTLVNRHGTGTLGVPYLAFVAPGLLTAAAMQTAAVHAANLVMGCPPRR
jgi:lipooligosaccharide transport system permease protein